MENRGQSQGRRCGSRGSIPGEMTSELRLGKAATLVGRKQHVSLNILQRELWKGGKIAQGHATGQWQRW